MKNEVKQAWVQALKSGEYKENTGKLLTSKGTFSPLGVLCKVYAKHNKKAPFDKGSRYFIPDKVLTWANLSDNKVTFKLENPKSKVIGNVYDLTTKYNFKEIAEIIDKNL